MFGLFNPSYVNRGTEMLKAAKRMLNYKRDLLPAAEVSAIESQMGALKRAIRARQESEVKTLGAELDNRFSKHFPPAMDIGIRENCEVFLVALVIAVGVRTFFLQPFAIPTGSMQPTLNGIRGYETQEPSPNAAVRALHFMLYGRSYVDVVSKADDTIIGIRSETSFRFFTVTKVECANQTFSIQAPARILEETFGITPGRAIRAGEIVARGYVNTGDHVFVDKVSFNFRSPIRSEVFVFNTQNISTRDNLLNPGGPSQFYIKRLAGLPGDELSIRPPQLFINHTVAQEEPFQRVMSLQGEHKGYSNNPAGGIPFRYLGRPEVGFRLSPNCYFALGDNSFHSSDSRDWGIVPQENLVGHALFVFWPFTSHWGFIK
jgi:signal peptidase I